MSEWIYDHWLEKRGIWLQEVQKWKGDIAPNALQKINVNSILARHCHPVPAGNGTFKVHDSFEGWVHTLSMTEQMCSCGYWQLNGIPCQHALACLPKRADPASLVSDYYKKKMYIKTYETNLEHTRGLEMWANYRGKKVEAPVMRCKPDRPKVNRLKSKDKVKSLQNKIKLSRKGITQRCSICRSDKHNKRNCPSKKKDKLLQHPRNANGSSAGNANANMGDGN